MRKKARTFWDRPLTLANAPLLALVLIGGALVLLAPALLVVAVSGLPAARVPVSAAVFAAAAAYLVWFGWLQGKARLTEAQRDRRVYGVVAALLGSLAAGFVLGAEAAGWFGWSRSAGWTAGAVAALLLAAATVADRSKPPTAPPLRSLAAELGLTARPRAGLLEGRWNGTQVSVRRHVGALRGTWTVTIGKPRAAPTLVVLPKDAPQELVPDLAPAAVAPAFDRALDAWGSAGALGERTRALLLAAPPTELLASRQGVAYSTYAEAMDAHALRRHLDAATAVAAALGVRA